MANSPRMVTSPFYAVWTTTRPDRVHLGHAELAPNRTACGLTLDVEVTRRSNGPEAPGKVTCVGCQRTVRYKTAVRQWTP